MASLGSKKKVGLDKKDLKAAIVKKNEALKEANKTIQAAIKSLKADKKQAEADLLSVRGDCEEVFNELQSAKTEHDAIIDATAIAKKELSKMRSDKSKTLSISKKAEKSLESSKKEHDALASKISYLQEQENEYKTLTKDLKALEIDIESNKDDLKRLKASKSRFKKQTDSLAAKCNDMVNKHNDVQKDLQDATDTLKAELEVIDKDLSIARSQCEKEKKELHSNLNDKNLDLDKVDSMIFKAESEYVALEKKINIAKNNILEEEVRIETIKSNFETWKVSAVDEVARMKLRGRIENIDKAGLKDVLGR